MVVIHILVLSEQTMRRCLVLLSQVKFCVGKNLGIFYALANDIKTSSSSKSKKSKKGWNEKQKHKLRKKFSQYTLYVIRISNNKLKRDQNIYENSKPCYHCTQVLKNVGIGTVVYSNQNNEFITEKTKDLETDHISQMNLHRQNNNIY